MHLYVEYIENLVSKNIIKTNGWNLQYMVKVANPFSYNQNFVLQGYLPFPRDIHIYKISVVFKSSSQKQLDHFPPDFTLGLLSKAYYQFVQTSLIIKQDGCHAHIWWKTLKNLLLQNQESFKTASCYRALGTAGHPNWFSDDPRLTFDLFTAWSNLQPYAFVWGKYWKFIFWKCIKDPWLKLTMYDQSSKHF